MQPQVQKYEESLVALAIDEAHCVKTWGDDSRTTFVLIGELCSLNPTGVSVIAIATSETLSVVTQRLSLVNPTLVALLPYRENVVYKVHKTANVESFTTSLYSELGSRRMWFPKTILSLTALTYTCKSQKKGAACTEPPNYPNTADFSYVFQN